MKNVEKKILVVTGESNPGTLALATSALTTELRQPTTSKTFTWHIIVGMLSTENAASGTTQQYKSKM